MPSIGSTVVGPEVKIFKMEALRWLENAILKLALADKVFHEAAISLIFEEEFTKRCILS